MNKKISTILVEGLIIVTIGVFVISPVSAKDILGVSENLTQFITTFITNISDTLSEEISNKQQFVVDFSRWKHSTDFRLNDVFQAMNETTLKYAESEMSIEDSSNQLIRDFAAISGQLDQIIAMYPQLEEVTGIIEPHLDEFEDELAMNFPPVGPAGDQGNPLGHIFEHYQNVERNSMLGANSFFRIEFLPPQENRLTLEENIIESRDLGIKQENIVFREINQYHNDVLIFHEVIVNGQVTETFKTLEELTIFHGLPGQMRQDGVNETVVLLVEEYLNLINFHLVRAFEEKGLDIDIDHPQLTVPPDYSANLFVNNFYTLVESLKEDFT